MARSRARARVACSAQGQPWGKMQSESARRAGEPSGHREEPSSEGLGGHQLLAQTDAALPNGPDCAPAAWTASEAALAAKRPDGR